MASVSCVMRTLTRKPNLFADPVVLASGKGRSRSTGLRSLGTLSGALVVEAQSAPAGSPSPGKEAADTGGKALPGQ